MYLGQRGFCKTPGFQKVSFVRSVGLAKRCTSEANLLALTGFHACHGMRSPDHEEARQRAGRHVVALGIAANLLRRADSAAKHSQGEGLFLCEG
jgi:hypothetical protein